MRDASQLGWSATGKAGVVAAGDARAVKAGIEILRQGGHAADAAVATILALVVTDHVLCSIGGEAPLMHYDARRRQVKVLCGQGRAPRSPAAIAWYMKYGIPKNNIKMAPVPSVVDLCTTTLQLYGTMSLGQTVEPALAILDEGREVWHPNLAATLRRLVEAERCAGGTREQKLQAASDLFYGRGPGSHEVADQLEDFYIERGGFLRKSDLAAHVTKVEDPVTVDYRGYTVCKCGPWTQGPVLCQTLRLLGDYPLRDMGHCSAEYIHLVTEAMKLAMADRDEYYGDPDFVDVPLPALLSEDYARLRRPLIDMQKASEHARPGDPRLMKPLKKMMAFEAGIGGTTTCVVADRWGNVVAATPSANVLHKNDGGQAGVTWGNRLRSFNTTPGHPNCIQPGKRPRITLTPTLVLKDSEPVLAISVAGGDLQDQTTLNVLLNFVEFDMTPQVAVVAPRFATAHHQDSFDPNPDRQKAFLRAGSLLVNDSVSESVRQNLIRRGHKIELSTSVIAHPVMLWVDHSNHLLHAAGDPAAGRHAAGID